MNTIWWEWTESVLTIPMNLEDTKKMLGTYNKILSKSNVTWAKEAWKFWEKNLDELAINFVKVRAKGVLGNEATEEKTS